MASVKEKTNLSEDFLNQFDIQDFDSQDIVDQQDIFNQQLIFDEQDILVCSTPNFL